MEIKGDHIKVLGCMPLHYGSQYMSKSIESVLDYCDEFLILYTPEPSYGFQSSEPLPESESMQNLRNIAEDVEKRSGKPFTWTRINASRENTHRNYGHEYAKKKGYDVSIWVDSDEVWQPDTVSDCIIQAYHGNFGEYRTLHSGWRHFYRNEKEYVTDGFQPVRLFNYNNYVKNSGIVDANKIDHYGYCIGEELMKYKLGIHGHKNGMRRDFFEFWKNYNKKEWDSNLYTHKKGIDWTLHPESKGVWFQTELLK